VSAFEGSAPVNNNNGPGAGKLHGAKLAAGLVIIGAVARLVPHPANLTPVGGTSLFAGARVKGWLAYAIPLALMLIADPLLAAIHGYPAFNRVTPVIYAAFLVNVWIGRRLLARINPARVAAASVLCSLQFFFVTNLGVWMLGNWYPHTPAGLATSFTLALPFLGRTMAGDLAYAGVLFGLDALAGRFSRSAQRKAAAPAQSAAA
jgi:hypothetical protein